ncbi:MAG: cytochrome c [Acidobacteriia bacterium]|nr:cytochrome c [Terriglobia bacterium]
MKISATLGLAIALVACRQDMHDQPKYKPLAESNFFADGRASRPIPENTVARDEPIVNDTYHTGNANGDFTARIPVTVDMALLRRGEERFDIFCSPCHGRLGDGNGMVAQRGFRIPQNLNSDRIRQAPPGYIFQVISNGYGGMPDHADQIPVRDRWAIVAYLRALELSRSARISDVPLEAQSQLEAQR